MVTRQAGRLVLIGWGAGIALSLGVTWLLRSELYGISATDPFTIAGVSILLAGVAVLASYIPARRAMHVDPVVALRHE
ncbi:MAG TPA: FtsX-like permease family protein, partial [Candidatus Acidoferrales bacterium]|nr:FtsX-like permease family protein [Candidatus Acidoferrales bacterium]